MKSYDYKKAKQLIEENRASLQKASLGMHEDWLSTSQIVWENGEFKKELPDNAVELERAFLEDVKNGLSMFKEENNLSELNKEFIKRREYGIKNIFGSNWATPTLQLVYANGGDKMIPCYISDGEEIDFGEKVQMQIRTTSGASSQDIQENITPLGRPED